MFCYSTGDQKFLILLLTCSVDVAEVQWRPASKKRRGVVIKDAEKFFGGQGKILKAHFSVEKRFSKNKKKKSLNEEIKKWK